MLVAKLPTKKVLVSHCHERLYNYKRVIGSEEGREGWRLVQYNLKAKNIITSALGMDEYFRVSNCKSAKDMWDTLQVTHEREQLMSKDLG